MIALTRNATSPKRPLPSDVYPGVARDSPPLRRRILLQCAVIRPFAVIVRDRGIEQRHRYFENGSFESVIDFKAVSRLKKFA